MSKLTIRAAIKAISWFSGFFASLLWGSPVLALKSDRLAPIEVSSETAEFDEKTGIVKHQGHVTMIQGSRQLKSDTLLIKRNAQQKIESLTAFGKPAHFQVQPDAKAAPLKAQAECLEFYPQTQRVVLTKQAQVNQDTHWIRGEHLVYHLDTRVLNALFSPGTRTTVSIPAH